jgi:hypothetical protein
MIALAKGDCDFSRLFSRRAFADPYLPLPSLANFKAGEKQLVSLIRGMWQRKKAQRLAAEAESRTSAEAERGLE